jgi:hypothetical protein
MKEGDIQLIGTFLLLSTSTPGLDPVSGNRKEEKQYSPAEKV